STMVGTRYGGFVASTGTVTPSSSIHQCDQSCPPMPRAWPMTVGQGSSQPTSWWTCPQPDRGVSMTSRTGSRRRPVGRRADLERVRGTRPGVPALRARVLRVPREQLGVRERGRRFGRRELLVERGELVGREPRGSEQLVGVDHLAHHLVQETFVPP